MIILKNLEWGEKTMDMFILLAARRSGITLLVRSLNSHPQITCYKKAFGVLTRFKYFKYDRPESKFYRYRSASLTRRLDYIFRKKQLIDDFMVETGASADGLKSVGVRLSYSHAAKHPEILEWAMENDVGIIHLVRENVLKTYVSKVTNKKRGFGHSTSEVEVVTVDLSIWRLKRNLARLTKQIQKHRAMLQGIRHLEVFYESFVANRKAETRRILDFLNIDQFVPLTTDLVKVNPDSLEQIIENYGEVKQALSGTPYEKFLDQQGLVITQLSK
jgi:LPS sulfotransferase NodH